MTSPNDNIADAVLLTTPSGALSGLNNVGATMEPGEPGRPLSLWYIFRLAANESAVHIDQIGSGFDSYLSVFKYPNPHYPPAALNFEGLTLAASNDDSGGGGAGSLTVPFESGYYAIQWSSFGSATTTSGYLNWSGMASIDPLFGASVPAPTVITPAYGGASVVLGAAGSGGGTAYEPPTTGRVYPSPDVYN